MEKNSLYILSELALKYKHTTTGKKLAKLSYNIIKAAIPSDFGKNKTYIIKYKKLDGKVVTRTVTVRDIFEALTTKNIILFTHDWNRNDYRSFIIDKIVTIIMERAEELFL